MECHTLIGVATIWLECLFENVPLDYAAPIISQQGEVRRKATRKCLYSVNLSVSRHLSYLIRPRSDKVMFVVHDRLCLSVTQFGFCFVCVALCTDDIWGTVDIMARARVYNAEGPGFEARLCTFVSRPLCPPSSQRVPCPTPGEMWRGKDLVALTHNCVAQDCILGLNFSFLHHTTWKSLHVLLKTHHVLVYACAFLTFY